LPERLTQSLPEARRLTFRRLVVLCQPSLGLLLGKLRKGRHLRRRYTQKKAAAASLYYYQLLILP
jgi:hypothetical protein